MPNRFWKNFSGLLNSVAIRWLTSASDQHFSRANKKRMPLISKGYLASFGNLPVCSRFASTNSPHAPDPKALGIRRLRASPHSHNVSRPGGGRVEIFADDG